MDANEYQRLAGRTLIEKPDFQITPEQAAVSLLVMELVHTTGAIADLVKKGIYHQHGLDQDELRKKLTDLLHVNAMLLAPIETHGERVPADARVMIMWNTLGLAGETGEVALLAYRAAKWGWDNQTPIRKELGDVLWYLSALCTKQGISLADVMQQNIEKLMQRYPEGYSSEASKQRGEE